MMLLFVGTDVSSGSQEVQVFVVGIRNAFVVLVVLCVLASRLSLVRGKVHRGAAVH
jgi:hypothetical protein